MEWTSELALTDELVSKINERKEVVYIPNFTDIKQETDFNFLADLLERNELGSEHKNPKDRPPFQGGLLSSLIQVRNVEKDDFFRQYLDIFDDTFAKGKYCDIHLHLSFMALSGASHQDHEDVFIIGLHGHTIYKVYGHGDYDIRKGDFIYIPPNISHKAIAMGPRIIMSIGVTK
jgi:mannose-6-phosphate isomerase-like protein (cupin superfamily)